MMTIMRNANSNVNSGTTKCLGSAETAIYGRLCGISSIHFLKV
jgi:hypothetical protein